MARTRGASQAFHQDDGELLDKHGKPIPTTGHPTTAAPVAVGAPVALVQPTPTPTVAYRYQCDRSTWARDMTGYEALLLLEALTGAPMQLTLTREEWASHVADVRRHFRRVTVQVPVPAPEDDDES